MFACMTRALHIHTYAVSVVPSARLLNTSGVSYCNPCDTYRPYVPFLQ